MKTRVISGLCMVPFALILFAGGKVLVAACAILTAVAMHEFLTGFKNMGVKPAFAVAYASLFALYAINLFADRAENYLAWVFASVLASLLILFDIEKRQVCKFIIAYCIRIHVRIFRINCIYIFCKQYYISFYFCRS